MKISKFKLKKIIESFLFEQEEDEAEPAREEQQSEEELEEEPEEESEEDPEEESEEEPEEESEEDPEEESEEDPDAKLENALKGKSTREQFAILVGKLKAGDKIKLPKDLRIKLSNLVPLQKRNEILNDESEYDELSFTNKYGNVIRFI